MLSRLPHPSRHFCVHGASWAVRSGVSDTIVAVFAGKVTRVNNVLRGSAELPVGVTFDVAQVWKGPVQQRMVIRTGSGGGDCGMDFRTGEENIVYAYVPTDAPIMGDGLVADICSRTSLLMGAQADLAALGAGIVPPPDTGRRPDIAATILLVGILLLATGLLVRTRRRRATG